MQSVPRMVAEEIQIRGLRSCEHRDDGSRLQTRPLVRLTTGSNYGSTFDTARWPVSTNRCKCLQYDGLSSTLRPAVEAAGQSQQHMGELSHFDESGASRMVDVGSKPVTRRVARASAQVHMEAATLAMIQEGRSAKGDVLQVARLAGIQAAKRTSDLIPLCHPLAIEAVSVDFTSTDDRTITIEATVQVEAKTGVEIEALTAVSIAALTIYDMCKSVDRDMKVQRIQLESKSGGRSGQWKRDLSSKENSS